MSTEQDLNWELESDELIRRRMAKTIEELAELSKVCSRILLQGMNAKDPKTNERLHDQLRDETADVLAQLDINIQEFGLYEIEYRRKQKLSLMRQWEQKYIK